REGGGFPKSTAHRGISDATDRERERQHGRRQKGSPSEDSEKENRRTGKEGGQRGQVPVDEQPRREKKNAGAGRDAKKNSPSEEKDGGGGGGGEGEGHGEVADVPDEGAGRFPAAEFRFQHERMVEPSRLEQRHGGVEGSNHQKCAEQEGTAASLQGSRGAD